MQINDRGTTTLSDGLLALFRRYIVINSYERWFLSVPCYPKFVRVIATRDVCYTSLDTCFRSVASGSYAPLCKPVSHLKGSYARRVRIEFHDTSSVSPNVSPDKSRKGGFSSFVSSIIRWPIWIFGIHDSNFVRIGICFNVEGDISFFKINNCSSNYRE